MTIAVVTVLLIFALRLRKKAAYLRSQAGAHKKDTLRSVRLMLAQMEYDARVLRLLRHARNARENENATDFGAALDTLIREETGMLDKFDRIEQFDGYLRDTYKMKKRPAAGDYGGAPEKMKEEIRIFIRSLEKIKRGDIGLLREKITFFERWVEGPERKQMFDTMKAMEIFLDSGDISGLASLKRKGGKAAGLRCGKKATGDGAADASKGKRRRRDDR